MFWILFALVPFILGVGISVVPNTPRWVWLTVIGIIVATEVLMLGKPSSSWNEKQTVTLWVIGVFMPWGVIAGVAVYLPFPRKRYLVALGLPMLYFLVLALGALLGDSFGLIPQ